MEQTIRNTCPNIENNTVRYELQRKAYFDLEPTHKFEKILQ